MKFNKGVLLLVIVIASFTIASDTNPVFARSSINSGQACSSRGQIRDFQAQRFICLKVNAKAGSSSGPNLIWFKIGKSKSVNPSTLISTPVSTSASVTTTSTTSLTKKKLLSASYEVLDATRIKIMWNFISSVREYRICVGDLCSGPNPQWLTISPNENSKILDLPLGQSQNYYVHALLLNDAKEYEITDTRPCCIGTKWTDSVTVSAKNNFSP